MLFRILKNWFSVHAFYQFFILVWCVVFLTACQADAEKGNEPEDTIKTLYQALDKGQIEKAYALSRNPGGRDEATIRRQDPMVKKELSLIAEDLKKHGGIKKIKVIFKKIHKPDYLATVRVEVETKKAEGNRTQGFDLYYMNGRWRASIVLLPGKSHYTGAEK